MKNISHSFRQLLTPILCAIMFMLAYTIVMPLQYAHAVSFVSTANTNTPTSITRSASGKIWVGSVASDNIKIYQASTKAFLVTITSITDPFQLATIGSRVYAFGGSNIYEFDAVANVLLRTTAHGCDTSGTFEKAFFDEDAGFVYCVTSGSLIKKINLTTMVADATSTTINTGANACSSSQDLSYDSTNDVMFLACAPGGTDYFVAIEHPFTSGTPDFKATQDNNLEIAQHGGKVLVCGTSTDLQWYSYTVGAGFGVGTSLAGSASNCGTGNSHQHLIFDDNSDRFIYVSNEDGRVMFIDSGDMAILYSNIPYGGTSPYQVYGFSNLLYYFANLEATFFQEMDATGIQLGDDSGGGGGVTLQSECPVDTNFDGIPNIIYRDIGGPDGVPDIHGNGGVPDGVCDAGSVPLGGVPVNQTICNFGFLIGLVPVNEDTGLPDDCDVSTNGLGYLLVIVLLAIMIAFFALAQMKTGLDIPDWLFIIGAFAVIGAATLFGWIDNTLFLIGIVVIAALASIKLVSKFNIGGFR